MHAQCLHACKLDGLRAAENLDQLVLAPSSVTSMFPDASLDIAAPLGEVSFDGHPCLPASLPNLVVGLLGHDVHLLRSFGLLGKGELEHRGNRSARLVQLPV